MHCYWQNAFGGIECALCLLESSEVRERKPAVDVSSSVPGIEIDCPVAGNERFLAFSETKKRFRKIEMRVGGIRLESDKEAIVLDCLFEPSERHKGRAAVEPGRDEFWICNERIVVSNQCGFCIADALDYNAAVMLRLRVVRRDLCRSIHYVDGLRVSSLFNQHSGQSVQTWNKLWREFSNFAERIDCRHTISESVQSNPEEIPQRGMFREFDNGLLEDSTCGSPLFGGKQFVRLRELPIEIQVRSVMYGKAERPKLTSPQAHHRN